MVLPGHLSLPPVEVGGNTVGTPEALVVEGVVASVLLLEPAARWALVVSCPALPPVVMPIVAPAEL